MKQTMVLTLLLIGILSSCKKEKENLETVLVIGDKSASITEFDNLIFPLDEGSILFPIDLDSNHIIDFTIYIDYSESPCLYYLSLNINCDSVNDLILCNDSILSPEILEFGDTLSYSNNWVSQKFIMLHATRDCSGNGETYTNGNWHDLTNKYVGIMIEKNGYLIYGWIKLSIIKTYYYYTIEVHEIGYKKIA
jgi:hypothetical protein